MVNKKGLEPLILLIVFVIALFILAINFKNRTEITENNNENCFVDVKSYMDPQTNKVVTDFHIIPKGATVYIEINCGDKLMSNEEKMQVVRENSLFSDRYSNFIYNLTWHNYSDGLQSLNCFGGNNGAN